VFGVVDLGREQRTQADRAGRGFAGRGVGVDAEADEAGVVAADRGDEDALEAGLLAGHAAGQLVAQAADGDVVGEVAGGEGGVGEAGTGARAVASGQEACEGDREDLGPREGGRAVLGALAPAKTEEQAGAGQGRQSEVLRE
jgi:hypothetical protein